MAHITRTPFITTGSLLAILAATGCGSGAGAGVGNMGGASSEENTGTVVLTLLQTPVANTCLVLSYSNGVATTYTLFATAGTSTASVALNLPNGSITITPRAYTTATCTSGGVAALTPSYNGPAVTVTVNPGAPTQVPLTLHPYLVTASVDFSPAVTSIALADSTSYALMSDGTMRSWGSNAQGQLGRNNTDTNANPTPIVMTMNGLSAASLANNSMATHMCAIDKTNGYAWCWGQNTNGQLGSGNTTNLLQPTVISGQAYSSLAVANGNTWAINRTTGQMWAWGANNVGQLGNGTTTQSLVPISQGAVYEQVTGCNTHYTARSGRAVTSTGLNTFGELGTGDSINCLNPTGTLFAVGLWPLSVASGLDHVCVATGPSGTVQCAGKNFSGQLGDGTTNNRLSPVAVSWLTGAIAVTASFSHTCALKNDSTIWCWGGNSFGQLGDGTSTDRYTPVQVVGISDAKMVAASDQYTCALRADATVWCWGFNGYGQLGDGTTLTRSVPTKVLITN